MARSKSAAPSSWIGFSQLAPERRRCTDTDRLVPARKTPPRAQRSSAHAEVSVEVVCVYAAERRGVLLQPFEERDSPERRLVRGEQPCGECADLVVRENDVAQNEAERARQDGRCGRRCMHDGRLLP